MADYPKCPICGATGPLGANMPNCACDYSKLREKAASWYKRQAREVDSGALSVTFRNFSARILDGLADHRLARVLEEQAEFDKTGKPFGSPDANQICSWCEGPATLRGAPKGYARCPVCWTYEPWHKNP